MTNPYRSQPDHCFWSRAVVAAPPGQLDPMVGSPFRITPDMKVATLGSCFAQNIARHLQRSGLNYFVPETAPDGLSSDEAAARNYGVFSARYGNVYTVRQALQLFDRAFGALQPKEDVWARGEVFVDPFRPLIEPEGFASPQHVRDAATTHLAYVRRVFSEADVLVFTLGLTEGWRSREDGVVFATAPGVAGGVFDPERHERVNFTAREVSDDLQAFCDRIAGINRDARILLTVSPVPLIATHRAEQHILSATTYSKAVLRVAAEEIAQANPHVSYFPSFEIITSAHSRGSYFEADLRSVREVGIAHVMRVFSRHFLINEDAPAGSVPPPCATVPTEADVVCDEEVIERALRASGFSS
ncbi:GSCFA domain-containing protein [Brevundimonas sp. Sa3CVA3]|uniref:GSCFA domain-containing protein n=2 Tax=Brevundimonas guildfordensis TaxID=2762241 RepID=A0ABR8QXY8_9CAUL|nr:GSCFA domain-containing protein [Brevundimonas guildfordensis]